jgi:hypothetical protein
MDGIIPITNNGVHRRAASFYQGQDTGLAQWISLIGQTLVSHFSIGCSVQ